MNLLEASRLLNKLGGGDSNELYCTRVHVCSRLPGYGWEEMELIINFVFYLLRKQRNHCKLCYLYERRQRVKTSQKPSPQEAEPAIDIETHKVVLEEVVQEHHRQ